MKPVEFTVRCLRPSTITQRAHPSREMERAGLRALRRTRNAFAIEIADDHSIRSKNFSQNRGFDFVLSGEGFTRPAETATLCLVRLEEYSHQWAPKIQGIS
ncbi:hypothetical protein [Pseudomonas fluorescens]|uniref:hypothetical protein n=1 Tax=Pseudomonas fluorescens TaxID=294 RepID=UPI0012407208|nr:hypothetical protein [Pseudomonas fluorescens]